MAQTKKKTLVILTTHFGSDFSGGSLATVEIFSRLVKKFSEIVVIGNQLGNHPFEQLTFHRYKNRKEAIRLIRNYPQHQTIFYGDFYNSYYFNLADRPFFFTYHDNWPELKTLGFKHRLENLFYWNIYKWIFKNSLRVVTVSNFKKQSLEPYCRDIKVIRNGFTKRKSLKAVTSKTHFQVLMIGNIDSRKYQYAVELFNEVMQRDSIKIKVDIYGRQINPKLSRKLSEFPFVRLKGYQKEIPFEHYELLLHTSAMENLPIVFCEAFYHNLPILSFNVGGSAEIINTDNGRIIDTGKTHSMMIMLERIINMNEKFDFSQKSRLEYFSWDKASEKYWALLNNTIQPKLN